MEAALVEQFQLNAHTAENLGIVVNEYINSVRDAQEWFEHPMIFRCDTEKHTGMVIRVESIDEEKIRNHITNSFVKSREDQQPMVFLLNQNDVLLEVPAFGEDDK